MKSYVVNFIRHGMTEANLTGRYAGIWDIPICSEGEEKLKSLKDSFEYPDAQELYSSPLTRCMQTCNIIYPDSKLIVADGLKECSFGEWEGKTTQELSNDERYIQWIKSDRKTAPPGGESGIDFYNRICLVFEEIVNSLITRGVTSASIFTHGGVIMLILSIYGLPKADFYDWIVDNGCGYSVRITPSLWMRDKVFEVYKKIPQGASGEVSGEFKDLIESLKNNR